MKDLWVILDANFLMIPENYGVDIFTELDRILDKKYKVVIPEVVTEELENLKEGGSPSERRAAKVALELSSRGEKVPSEEPADKEIMRLAQEKNCVVATNDKNLRKKLREKGISTILLRQKTHLNTEGSI